MVDAERSAEAAALDAPTVAAVPASRAPEGDEALVSRLKSVHQRMAGKSYKDSVSAQDRAGIVEILTLAGSALAPGAGRDWLRNALFYWVSEQASHGERERFAPAPLLGDYTGGSPPEAVLRWLDLNAAEAVAQAASPQVPSATRPAPGGPAIPPAAAAAPTSRYAGPANPAAVPSGGGSPSRPVPTTETVPTTKRVTTTEPAPAARPALTTQPAPAGMPASPAVPPASLAPAEGDGGPIETEAFAPAITAAAEQGQPSLIRRDWRRGGRSAAIPAPASASAAPPPPPLATASELSEDEARRLVRISALARQWRLTDEANRKGYLIDDRVALQEASRFTLLDPDIRELVEASEVHVAASERAAKHRRRLLISLIIAALLGLLIAVTAALLAEESRRVAAESQSKADQSQREAAESQREATELRNRELRMSNTAERQEIRSKVQTATDALRHNDIKPLVALLGELGGADVSDLGRLQLKPASPTESDSDSITK